MKPAKRPPVAFLSYVRFDDEHDRERLRRFRDHLQAELELQTGEDFLLLDDRNDLHWSQAWTERVRETLEPEAFLLPVLTPAFFRSPICREEYEVFLERERKLRRNDLVFPVYYVGSPLIDDLMKRSADKIAQNAAQRAISDWRDLRFEPSTSPQVGKTLAQLAQHLGEARQRSLTPGRSTASGHGARKAVNLVGLHEARARVSGGNGNGHREGDEPVAAEPIPLLQYTELVSETTEAARRIAEKTVPPVLTVDASGRGVHSTIGEAIRAANPGDRILVRPGVYHEGLVLDKPLEIIGDGALGEVVVEASGQDAVLFRTTMGRVANLVLRQTGGGEWYGVAITQGRLELEDCDVTSASLACVAIHGGAEARLRRNVIHDGKSSGVLILENGQGSVEDNDIRGNAMAGVLICAGANPAVHRNRIHGGLGTGVQIEENGLGTLEDNDISGHPLAEVVIARGGNATLRRNRIHGGHRTGVLVYEHGLGTLEANDIFGNTLTGVLILTGANPTLRRNRIHGGQQHGVLVGEYGAGVLEENDIYGNLLANVAIQSGGKPLVRRNRIHDSQQNGILVEDNGHGVLEDNTISSNLYAGVLITSGGNPTLRRNRIKKNGYKAIVVESTGCGVVENNDLRGNQAGAIDVSHESKSNLSLAHNQE